VTSIRGRSAWNSSPYQRHLDRLTRLVHLDHFPDRGQPAALAVGTLKEGVEFSTSSALAELPMVRNTVLVGLIFRIIDNFRLFDIVYAWRTGQFDRGDYQFCRITAPHGDGPRTLMAREPRLDPTTRRGLQSLPLAAPLTEHQCSPECYSHGTCPLDVGAGRLRLRRELRRI
jgi:hypothetical protein